jgi:hypothetical protein
MRATGLFCGSILRTVARGRLAFAEAMMLALMMAALLTRILSEIYSRLSLIGRHESPPLRTGNSWIVLTD